MQRSVIGLAGLSLLAVVAGCNRASDPPVGGPVAGVPKMAVGPKEGETYSGPFAAGRKAYVANNCARCHRIGDDRPPLAVGPPGSDGPGGKKGGKMGGKMSGKMGGKGPDLTRVGADPAHTVDWLMAHIRNAKGHKPDSRMPPYEGKIQENDLRALAEYLASLK